VHTGGWPAEFTPNCFVCGPTGFVETVADILVALGHDAHRIKTERFGPTGGPVAPFAARPRETRGG
jgi:ferredoxin-NADP reductase